MIPGRAESPKQTQPRMTAEREAEIRSEHADWSRRGCAPLHVTELLHELDVTRADLAGLEAMLPSAAPMNVYLVSRWGNAKAGADGEDTNFLVIAPSPEAAVALGDATLLDHPWLHGPNVRDFCHCVALLGSSWSPESAVIHGPWVATNTLRWRAEDGMWISGEFWTRHERGPLEPR